MALVTTEMARVDWSRALSEFSARHEGWLVSSDILSMAFGVQREVTDVPLVGLTFEPRGAGAIALAVEGSSGDHLTHTIEQPSRIWVEQGPSDGSVFLEVESVDGVKVILRFRRPA